MALLRAALRADARAQLELVRRLTPTLRAVATAILGRGGDADDGVQVSLMRVLERASTYRGDASLERWARTVAVRACLRLAGRLAATTAPTTRSKITPSPRTATTR
ncbi:MAG: sigma-70 family RNA polymerase sigma factor [Deltaproteobacteria bacterium]|nr:sigma-70 family RNA polymerase sigma factor [Deltaproteobacteria bacterium]